MSLWVIDPWSVTKAAASTWHSGKRSTLAGDFIRLCSIDEMMGYVSIRLPLTAG